MGVADRFIAYNAGPEEAYKYNTRSAVQQLAQDPDFANASPAEQSQMLAKITGDPASLAAAAQQGKMAGLNLSNPQSAIKTLQQYMSPEQATGLLTNPMAYGMMGLGGQGATPAPAGGQPAAGTAPTAGGQPPVAGAAPAAPMTPQAPPTPDDYISRNVPPFYQNQVKDILQGGELAKDIPQKDRTVIMNWAHQADPNYSEAIGAQRAAAIKNATSGDMYKLSTSLNTGMGHLYDLHELGGNLQNGKNSTQAGNWTANFVQSHLEPGGNPDLARYNSSLKTAAPEIAKYLGGGAATDTGTEEASSSYNPDLPSATIQQNAKDLGAKMMTKGGALQAEYDAPMGALANNPTIKRDIVNPQTAALYADMQGKPLTFEQQKMVNDHRAEANLPPKKWGAKMTVSKPVPLQTNTTPTADQARAALIARGRLKQ